MRTDLIRKGSIEEIIGRRDRALELFAQAFKLLQAAHECGKSASETSHGLSSMVDRGVYYRIQSGKLDEALEEVRQELDANVWRYIHNATKMRGLMDAADNAKFEAGLIKDKPHATVENVSATFADLYSRRDAIFRSGLVDLFRRLNPRKFRTNDAFKIGPKIILDNVFAPYGWNHYSGGRDHLADLDRVLHVLDGKEPPDHRGNVCALMGTEHRNGKPGDLETEYLAVKWFKNGNVHATIKRADLVQAANRLIAEHYGAVLAEE